MKRFYRTLAFLVIPGILILLAQCVSSTKERKSANGELNLASIREVAIRSAMWSLDNNLDGMSYQNMCAAYGILKVAAATGNDSLRKGIERNIQT